MLGTRIPVPSFFPEVHTVINDYLAFDLNWSALWAIMSLLYYYVLEPTAAVRLVSVTRSCQLGSDLPSRSSSTRPRWF